VHVHFVESFASLTETPCDVVAAVGRTATFQCAANKKLGNNPTSACWKYKESSSQSSGQEVQMHAGTKDNVTFSKLHNTTYQISDKTSNLTLHNVKMTDAGIYVCYECKTSKNRADAELLVFGEFYSLQ
jgi:Immunoglobulin V-set domain